MPIISRQFAICPPDCGRKVDGLSVEQLTTPYNAPEWTIAQNIHHLADTHMVCIRRFKLILTSPTFQFTAYDVKRHRRIARRQRRRY